MPTRVWARGIRATIGASTMPRSPDFATPLLEPLKQALRLMPEVRLAVLFGSVAARTDRSHSDLDVGVLLEPTNAPTPSLTVALERATGRRVDLVLLDAAPPLLRFEIARSGVLLVERQPHAWAEFRAHAMIDWWDWVPTADMMHRAMAARLKEEAEHGPS
jgi:predicted nucleotidyltransferase